MTPAKWTFSTSVACCSSAVMKPASRIFSSTLLPRCDGLLGAGARSVLGRRLEQAGDDGRFGQREIASGLAEVAVGGRLDAVGAAAEIDAVEVELENVTLAELELEPERHDELLELAGQRALGAEIEVLRQLLGQRRSAFGEMAGAVVGIEGADKPDRVEPHMAEEAAVLGGEDGIRYAPGQKVERNVVAACSALIDERAVARQDAGHGAGGRGPHRQRIGQGQREVEKQDADRDGDKPEGDRGSDEGQTQEKGELAELAPDGAGGRVRRLRRQPVGRLRRRSAASAHVPHDLRASTDARRTKTVTGRDTRRSLGRDYPENG